MSAGTILIAEDDSLMAELIQHRLEKDGHKTVIVRDGAEVFNQTAQLQPDAVILDGMLPGKDGFQILRDLKTDDQTKEIPVIMLTARGLEKDVVDGFSLGADDYIVKPFMPNELSARLSRVLAQRPPGN